MTPTPLHVEPDPAAAIEVPAVGTPGRTLYKDDDLRVVVFGFAEREELSEQTASRPAVIQVLRRPAHERDRRISPGSEPATGIVLAGGRSSRMGVAKAGIAWEGSTLLGRAVAALGPVCGRVIVVRSPGQDLPALPHGVTLVEDALPDRGPLEGLAAGLRAAGPGGSAFVCAADMPLLDAEFAARVLSCLPPGADAAVPRVHGHPQPLAAAYRTDLLCLLEALLAAGRRSFGDLLDRLEVCWLDDLPGAADAVRNVNTPAELEEARQASRGKRATE